ncbi:MAG: ATP-binding protein, partial [Deltaproteobacteria bacterium]|nr:ATP-binding protein [Deltaproteobacteria bacterium]
YLYNAVNPWWEGKDFNSGINRDIYPDGIPERLRRSEQIEVLIGGCGVGKTTLLKQVIRRLLDGGMPASAILYLPLHYPAFSEATLAQHLKTVREQIFRYGCSLRFVFFDEIQEIFGWERKIRELYAWEGLKIFCAGTMPPPAKGPGRQSTRRSVTLVHPLSFREFIRFRGHETGLEAPEQLIPLAEEYLRIGGYPAQVIDPAGDTAARIMASAPVRCIDLLYGRRKTHHLQGILQSLCASVGSPTSYRQLAGDLRLSVDTIKDYLEGLEGAWLAKPLRQWRSRGEERLYATRKFYLGDNGIRTVLAGDADMAGRAENAVFLDLWRRGIPCGYDGESGGVVDFVLGSRARPLPVDVRYETILPGSDGNLSGIRAFIRKFPRTREAVVVSRNVEGSVKIDGVAVRSVPLWKFLRDGGVC